MEGSVLRQCKHCQDWSAGMYCNYCKTKEQRISMDKENEAHFRDKNLGYEHNCPDYSFKVEHVHTPTCQKDLHEGIGNKEFDKDLGLKRYDYRGEDRYEKDV